MLNAQVEKQGVSRKAAKSQRKASPCFGLIGTRKVLTLFACFAALRKNDFLARFFIVPKYMGKRHREISGER
jgi:hypothetical protein